MNEGNISVCKKSRMCVFSKKEGMRNGNVIC